MESSEAEEWFSQDILDFLFSPAVLELEGDVPMQPTLGNEPHLQQSQPTSFAIVTDADIEKLKDKNTNQNTAKTTTTWARRFQKWQEERGLSVQPSSQPEPAELDRTLQRYFAELRKEDGSEYEPDSLRTMLASLDRLFKEGGYKHAFSKTKSLKAQGKCLMDTP